MPLRWDPLIVRELARELDGALAGAHARALRFDGASRSLTLVLRETTLDWSLHPSRGEPLLIRSEEPRADDLPLRARVRQVRSEPDERVLVIEFLPERGWPGRDLVIELLGNQWNALVVERPSGTVRHVLVRRGPPRAARVGGTYVPPPASLREGAAGPIPLARWLELLESVPPPDRARSLVTSVAWTSPLNAAALVDAGPDPARALEEGHALWSALVLARLPPAPVLRAWATGRQPYPWPLPGAGGDPVPSLLAAFRMMALGAEAGGAPPVAPIPAELVADLERARDTRLRQVNRLRSELEALEDSSTLRSRADLLLARLRDVPPGSARVVLEGFDGVEVTLVLDPARSPKANADALYQRAARADRARARIPGLVEEAERRAEALERLLARVRSGEASVEEASAALPRREKGSRTAEGSALPYRVYRSSGGLEIRVGRGARHNDELTFRHAAPGDVWLHARDAAGAHVVLRWGKPGNPPHRDLEEAAGLAALHCKARTSGLVPVDWTLRKHVRKPRGSPPGTVVPERAKTVMVRPDAALLETLATDP